MPVCLFLAWFPYLSMKLTCMPGADYLCNWMGNLAVANAIDYSGQLDFVKRGMSAYQVNGTSFGEFKTVENLSWLRVYSAGHLV